MKNFIFIFILLANVLAKSNNTSMLERLNSAAKAILNEKIKSSNDLKTFQIDLLKKRNSQCVTYEDLENNVFRSTADATTMMTKENIDNMFNDKCLDSNELSQLTGNSTSYSDLAELLLWQFYNDGCDLCKQELHAHKHQSYTKAWIFGLLAATMITLSSFSGALLLPLTKHKHYKRILMFLISLAIGTLTGTALIHLIPQAYGIEEDANYIEHHMYIKKSLVISAGLYLFFIVEQIMRFFMQLRKHRKLKKKELDKTTTTTNNNESLPKPEKESNSNSSDSSSSDDDYDPNDIVEYKLNKNKNTQTSIAHHLDRRLSRISRISSHHGHGHSHGIAVGTQDDEQEEETIIAPVAWIIICSEGLHNFIDGLSIGAAFTETLLKGFSLSLAIICEEFPHKLGDFAILLAAGMSFKMALFCNFLSSCLIYIGVALGIIVGENLGINMWIYAIAAGMFIYIAVCDMIPELSEMGSEIERAYVKSKHAKLGISTHSGTMNAFSMKIRIQNMIIQNAGVLIGYFLMLLIALYAEKIVI